TGEAAPANPAPADSATGSADTGTSNSDKVDQNLAYIEPEKLTEEVKASLDGECGDGGPITEERSFWGIFLGGFLGGFLALLTPCVFPMIPMTVSFFLKQSAKGDKGKGRINALMYGFFIIAIYVLISLPFHIFQSLSPDIFYEISTNVYLNIFFFVIFLIFAISFLGAFEITIPSGIANKVDNASNYGGFIGIFFMALTLIIVSFSCTGPALGLVIGSVFINRRRCNIINYCDVRFWFWIGFAVYVICFVPKYDGKFTKIWRLVKYGESSFWIY
ncbi:MAG: hypothetical protein LRY32_06295, partial [Flavobacterium sp.]|nr:hypothetical protein [Flavobacterium sp.]